MARKKKGRKRMCTLDAETDPFKVNRIPIPFAWGLYFGHGEFEYFWGDDCTEQLLDYLKTEENLCIYAHNGGKFDYFYLLDAIHGSIKIINGRISKAKLFGTHELRDSYNIIPYSLKNAYKKDDIDYEYFERDKREKHKHEIIRYLKSDCEYLYDLVFKFEEQFGRQLTIAGTAFKELQKTGVEIPPTYEAYDDLFRQFYYGGRVQCFEVGAFKEELIYIDINSAYPHAMKQKHPFGGQFIESSRMPDRDGVYFAIIEAVSKGALPCRGVDGKLVFPTDNTPRTYYCSSWEIQAGLDTGTLEIIKFLRVFKHVLTQDFNSYVDQWYEQKRSCKENNDEIGELFAKLMLNSAYGKFGQDGRKFEEYAIEEYGGWPAGDGWEPYSNIEAIKDYQLFSRPDPRHKFYNVATAASITGFVRANMWRAICDSDGAIYCDTDSIICRRFSGCVGDGLGEWKIEGILDEAYIAQKKMYAVHLKGGEWKKACKGVNLTAEQIRDGVITGETISSTREAPNFSLRGAIKNVEDNYTSFSTSKVLTPSTRFIKRKTNFENIEKNTCTIPTI